MISGRKEQAKGQSLIVHDDDDDDVEENNQSCGCYIAMVLLIFDRQWVFCGDKNSLFPGRRARSTLLDRERDILYEKLVSVSADLTGFAETAVVGPYQSLASTPAHNPPSSQISGPALPMYQVNPPQINNRMEMDFSLTCASLFEYITFSTLYPHILNKSSFYTS